MKEALMGIETEYGLYLNHAGLVMAQYGHLSAPYIILDQLKDVISPFDFWVSGTTNHEFWARNGMRGYIDTGAHIELATPECGTFSDLIFQKNICEKLLLELLRPTSAVLERDYGYRGPLEIYANNTAGREIGDGGCDTQALAEDEVTFSRHENYLLRRDSIFTAFGEEPIAEVLCNDSVFRFLVGQTSAFFAARMILGGAGHITPNSGKFILSPRANRMQTPIGGSTTSGRAFICTRNESQTESYKFLRYHHIAGDTNITDHILKLKMAFTYYVLRLVERGVKIPSYLEIPDNEVLLAAKLFNFDPELKATVQLKRGRKLKAAEILQIYLDLVAANKTLLLFEPEDEEILKELQAYLTRAKRGYEALIGESEWATKYYLMKREMAKRQIDSLNHPVTRRLSMALHNIERDPLKNNFAVLRSKILPENLDVGDIRKAVRRAPPTRAFLRGLGIYLANQLGYRLDFPGGNEWCRLNLSIGYYPNCYKRYEFKLCEKTPWTVTVGDIKDLVATVKYLLNHKKEPEAINPASSVDPASAIPVDIIGDVD